MGNITPIMEMFENIKKKAKDFDLIHIEHGSSVLIFSASKQDKRMDLEMRMSPNNTFTITKISCKANALFRDVDNGVRMLKSIFAD